jgi:hypothetical protein
MLFEDLASFGPAYDTDVPDECMFLGDGSTTATGRYTMVNRTNPLSPGDFEALLGMRPSMLSPKWIIIVATAHTVPEL